MMPSGKNSTDSTKIIHNHRRQKHNNLYLPSPHKRPSLHAKQHQHNRSTHSSGPNDLHTPYHKEFSITLIIHNHRRQKYNNLYVPSPHR